MRRFETLLLDNFVTFPLEETGSMLFGTGEGTVFRETTGIGRIVAATGNELLLLLSSFDFFRLEGLVLALESARLFPLALFGTVLLLSLASMIKTRCDRRAASWRARKRNDRHCGRRFIHEAFPRVTILKFLTVIFRQLSRDVDKAQQQDSQV